MCYALKIDALVEKSVVTLPHYYYISLFFHQLSVNWPGFFWFTFILSLEKKKRENKGKTTGTEPSVEIAAISQYLESMASIFDTGAEYCPRG